MKYFLLILIPILVIHYYVSSPTTSSSTQYPHTTVKILDGDTFILNGEHIRLLGINAPEIFHWDKKADCWAYQSMSRLEYYLTRIRPKSDIQIQREGKDKYWRTLALVFISGSTTDSSGVWSGTLNWTPINQLMVREWFAETFRPEGWVPAPDYTADALIAIDKLAGNLSHCNY